MSTLDDVRAEVAQLASQRDATLTSIGTATNALDMRLQQGSEAAGLGDDTTATSAQADADQLRQQRRGLLTQLDGLDQSVRDAIDKLRLAGIDPCDAEIDVPLVLLPVRLETRYTDDGATLRVRIYPDDAHVDRLDAGLSASERSAGEAYWNAIWTGGDAGDDAAWKALVAAVHPKRAPWVAFSLTPTNLASRPEPPAAGPAPAFPDVPDRTNRAPVARALPDRFVAVVRQAASESRAIGAPVAPEVVVGLPRDDDASALLSVHDTPLGPGMTWMVDYDAAKQIGLAVDVPLAQPGQPVDLVLVFGLRTSADPDASAQEMRRLFLAHRFSDGAAFVEQGTPTNNTETDRAAWTRRPEPVPPATRVAAQPGPPGTNASVATEAFGMAADVLAGLTGGDAIEQTNAAAAHTALWEPTWATLFDRLQVNSPGVVLDDLGREAVRDVFISHVRGRGPLPTLRLGKQPYGLLPVSSVDRRWAADPSETIEAGLVALLRRIRAIWRGGIDGVPTLRSPGNLDDVLLEILGSAPQSIGLRVRSIASQSACVIVPPLLGIGDNDTALQQLLDAILWRALGFPDGFIGLGGALGKTTRPLGLPLVADSDPAFIGALLADGARTIQSVLQALLELALNRARQAVAAAAPDHLVGTMVGTGIAAAGDLAERVRQLADLTVQGDVRSSDLHSVADDLVAHVGGAGPVLLASNQPIAGLRGSLADVALQTGIDDSARPPLALQSVQAWFRAQARLADLQAALKQLADSTTAVRGIAVREALDCSSHRLDAWTTALPARRLERMRAARPQGLLLGAYGWVERLERGDSTTLDGGYLLAPSLAHASTAGVLRSAYLHHNDGPTGSGAFAIDLTSARARDGLALLSGVRSGQPLGALLGYRFERRLNETSGSVNRFVLSLRALAPLVSQRLTDRAEAPPKEATEAIAAANVVDGIRLLTLRGAARSETEQAIRTSLGEKPKNPYLPTSPAWTGPSDAEWTVITDAMDEIAAQYDAAADLLLAEAVHQLVQGNPSTLAATLDATAGGDAVPADPMVTKIPARGAAITHRVVLLVRDAAPGAGGWNTTTPRARAEPRLEAWAEALLGPADKIVVQTTADGATHLDTAGLCALDLVYDSPLPGVLERRIRAALPDLGPGPLAQDADSAWPPGLRALGEVSAIAASMQRLVASARPALPKTFARAGEKPKRQITQAALDGLLQRLSVAATKLGTQVDALGASLRAQPVDPNAIAHIVAQLAAYGISFPGAFDDTNIATLVHAEGTRRLKAHADATVTDAESAIATGKLLFGDTFWALPVVSPSGGDLFAARFDAVHPKVARIRRFLRDHASVRKNLGFYTETLLFSDALAVNRRVRIVQLAATGTAGTTGWLGLPFVDGQPSPSAPVTDLIVETVDDMRATDAVAGLLFDEWIEVAPTRIARPGTGGDTTVETLVTSGLAANVDVPNARAPQAILLAVPPDAARWTSDAIADVLTETMELAKLRAVTLERAPWAARVLPALQEQSWSLQGEETLDILKLATELFDARMMIPFVKDAP